MLLITCCYDVMLQSCQEKTSEPHIYRSHNQIIDLFDGNGFCGESSVPDVIYCNKDTIRVRASRERWWFIAISRCNPDNATVTVSTHWHYVHLNNYQSPTYGVVFNVFHVFHHLAFFQAWVMSNRGQFCVMLHECCTLIICPEISSVSMMCHCTMNDDLMT